MRVKPWSIVLALIAAAAITGGLYVGPPRRGVASRAPATVVADGDPARAERHGHGETHDHPAVPPTYASARLDPAAWNDPRTLAEGKQIYDQRCASCHGERGDGKGAGGMTPHPTSFRDAHMISEMSDSYMFWRVSDGNTSEPFASQGSAMPPWKQVLSPQQRWAVIAYITSFTGDAGAHTATSHDARAQPSASPK